MQVLNLKYLQTSIKTDYQILLSEKNYVTASSFCMIIKFSRKKKYDLKQINYFYEHMVQLGIVLG